MSCILVVSAVFADKWTYIWAFSFSLRLHLMVVSLPTSPNPLGFPARGWLWWKEDLMLCWLCVVPLIYSHFPFFSVTAMQLIYPCHYFSLGPGYDPDPHGSAGPTSRQAVSGQSPPCGGKKHNGSSFWLNLTRWYESVGQDKLDSNNLINFSATECWTVRQIYCTI